MLPGPEACFPCCPLPVLDKICAFLVCTGTESQVEIRTNPYLLYGLYSANPRFTASWVIQNKILPVLTEISLSEGLLGLLD